MNVPINIVTIHWPNEDIAGTLIFYDEDPNWFNKITNLWDVWLTEYEEEEEVFTHPFGHFIEWANRASGYDKYEEAIIEFYQP